jgi:hypothetical protein
MSDSSSARVITRLLPALVAGCALAALLPSAALASSPSASTDGVTVTGAATATVDGSVNPGGETTTYDAGYDLASSDWCTSGGASGSPANATTAQTLGFTDTVVHDVSVDLTGLTPGTQYCAAVVASNSSASATGEQIQFGAGLPLASTFDANATGASTATVDGGVNPSGQTTTYKVEYDVADSDWCQTGGESGSPADSTAAQTLGFTDSAPHDVTVGLSGLSHGTDYCADLVASNSSGDADGGQAFLEAALPNVLTEDTFATGATTAKVDAIVNGIGQPTSYAVQYDLASSQWCETDGDSGGAAHSTPSQPLAFTDSNDHDVSVVVTGLIAATDYCADLVATNASGSEDGGQLDFTTLTAKPTVATGPATDVGPMKATLTSAVNPSGLATTWHFEYGTTENYGSSTPSAGAGSGATPETEATEIASLSPGTTYHYRIIAANSDGTTDGPDRTFTTTEPPTVATKGTTDVGVTRATIHGTVNPNGLATTVHFDYGKTSGYGSSTHIAGAGSGSSTLAVISGLAGLLPRTTYHYRLVATSPAGTRDGSDRTFKTSAHARPPTLSRVALASSKFSAGTGTKLRFTLSERARITVVIRTKVVGHKSKMVKVATLRFAGVKGRNTHRLKTLRLRPRHYTMTMTARDAAGRASKPATVRFTIVRSKESS